MPWALDDLPKDPKPPVRSKEKKTFSGEQGRIIKLRANHYPIAVKSWNITLYHYDVVIEEPRRNERELPKRKKQQIFEELKRKQQISIFAYDGMKSAVSTIKMKQFSDGRSHEVEAVGDSGKKSRYFVKIKLVNTHCLIDVQKALNECMKGKCVEFPSTIFQMMEIMFRHTPSNHFLSVGRNSFFPMDDQFGASSDIGEGKIVSQGFFGSIRPGWKLFLNVDVAHAAFYKEQGVLDFLKETIHLEEQDLHEPLTESNRKKLEMQLTGLKVQVTHSEKKRTYKVIGVMNKGADTQNFEFEKGKLKSVQNYFAETYPRVKLQYPKLNVIRVAPVNRTIYLPIECCRINKGQKVNKALSENATSQFIQYTAKTPSQRLQKCNTIVKKNNFSMDPMMKALGFSVSDFPVQLDGRVLPAPTLAMKNVDVLPEKGVWEAWNKEFYTGANIKTWAVVNYDTRSLWESKLREFIETLMKFAKERGMTMPPPVKVIYKGRNPDADFKAIKNTAKDIQLIFVNLPSKTGDTYAQVKMIGDREIGVVTQCILSKNLKQIKPATVNNVLLKINAKMGGINNAFGKQIQSLVFTTPVMILGADVNHPPADDRKGTPSLAAVVGSMDRYGSNYAVQVRQQFSRQEIIQDLQQMTRNLLISFYRRTGRKPERLVMYRDGVSESQFNTVLASELRAMRDACTSLEPDYKPAMTFIVVQKRHHTRLFCDEKDGVGRSKNVPPGTIVDTTITHPSEIDFFLNSHQGLLGTSRPTHYRVLWDDNNMSMDNLQSMTYALCHTCFRCTRSVSLPAPAYYAHLAAYRAKVHSGACAKENIPKDGSVPDISKFVQMDQSFPVHNRMYFL